VRTTIYSQDKLSDRVTVIIRWVEIAMILESLKNYSSLMQIIIVLTSSLHLLKRTKKELKSQAEGIFKSYEKLQNLCSVEDLSGLKQAMNESDCCIPYLGLYLAQITRLQETLVDDPQTGTINYQTRKRIASIILSLLNHKKFIKRYQKRFTDFLRQDLTGISYIILHSTLIPEEIISQLKLDPPELPLTPPPEKIPKRPSKITIPSIKSPSLSPRNISPLLRSPKSSPRWITKVHISESTQSISETFYTSEVSNSPRIFKIGTERIKKTDETSSE
jgi:hypothetical protein